MMKKINFLNRSAVLGLLFCSFAAQAMEQGDDRKNNHIAKLKKDVCVFDHWVLDQIRTNLSTEEIFPQEVINLISTRMVNLPEDFLYDVIKLDRNLFVKSLCFKMFDTKNGAIYSYKDRPYEIESKRVSFLQEKLNEGKLKNQVIKMTAFLDNTFSYGYETSSYSFLHGKEIRTCDSFQITFLDKNQLKQRENDAHSCYDNLRNTWPGKHDVDYYPNGGDYFRGMNLPHLEEWSWENLHVVEYQIYDRRMEYETASPEGKAEMLGETSAFRKNAAPLIKDIEMLREEKEILGTRGYLMNGQEHLIEERNNIRKRLKEIKEELNEKEAALKNL